MLVGQRHVVQSNFGPVSIIWPPIAGKHIISSIPLFFSDVYLVPAYQYATRTCTD